MKLKRKKPRTTVSELRKMLTNSKTKELYQMSPKLHTNWYHYAIHYVQSFPWTIAQENYAKIYLGNNLSWKNGFFKEMAWYRYRAAFEIVDHDSMSSYVMNVEVTKIWATSEIFWTPNKQNQINPKIQCIIQGVSGNAPCDALWNFTGALWTLYAFMLLSANEHFLRHLSTDLYIFIEMVHEKRSVLLSYSHSSE